MAKKTQAEWEKVLEDVIVELIKEHHIHKNDEEDFAQEIRIYSFLNMDKAAHKSVFIYNLKKGKGVQKIIDKFTAPDFVGYLEDNTLEEYSMYPVVYRHEIMETVLKLVSDTEEYFSQKDKYIPYFARRAKLVDRNTEIFLRHLLYNETYAELGKEYNLSSERIRGIVKRYLLFLRHPMYSKRIKSYTEDDLR